MKSIVYIILLLSAPFSLFGQQFYIKGDVKDESGNLLQNVSIRHLKTGYIFYTGNSGGFGIQTNTGKDSLLFALDGFQKQIVQVSTGTFNNIILKRSQAKQKGLGFELISLTKGFKREALAQWATGNESYASTVENGFVSARKFAATGVSLSVDKASYSNIRRFINNRQPVPPDAVRIEEMVNYFNLQYKSPLKGQDFLIESYLSSCPWNVNNQLLFARICSRKVDTAKLPPSHLVFLIDVSASMDMDNRLPLIKAGFTGLVNNLRNIDSVSLVIYGGTTAVILESVTGSDKKNILNVIDSLQTGGSTPGESGIRLAYTLARKHFIRGGNNRVVLATDGDFNVGLQRESDLETMIVSQREAGIYLTCLGIGMGNYKDSKIQVLAKKGNGNFAYIDSYAEAEKVLIKEFTQTIYAIADDTYLNIQFNPSLVKEYRLLGFDNKAGALKDTLATLEGGEIGAAHSTLVVFEIIPDQIGQAGILQPVKFTLTYTSAGKKHEEIIYVPDLSPAPFHLLDKPLQFVTAVTMFGSLLKESRFSKSMSWAEVLKIATLSADMTNPSQREFVSLATIAKEIYGKKKRKN